MVLGARLGRVQICLSVWVWDIGGTVSSPIGDRCEGHGVRFQQHPAEQFPVGKIFVTFTVHSLEFTLTLP